MAERKDKPIRISVPEPSLDGQIQVVQDIPDEKFIVPLDGEWLPFHEPALIGKNFSEMSNVRYGSEGHPESVLGMTALASAVGEYVPSGGNDQPGGGGGVPPSPTTVKHVYIEGVLWTGAVRTVGTGHQFSTLRAAVLNANEVSQDSVYLCYGTLGWMGSAINAAFACYILGMGATPEDTNITWYGNPEGYFFNNLYLENCIISPVGLYGNTSGLSYGLSNVTHPILKTNRVKIKTGAPAYPCIEGPWDEVSLKNTYLNATIAIDGQDLSVVSLDKVSYDSPWNVVSCTNSLALDDKAVDGTPNYGADYGTAGALISYV